MTKVKEKGEEEKDALLLISKEYVQNFAEDNFNMMLTSEQLELVSDALCGWAVTNALDHIDDAIYSAIQYAIEDEE